MEKLNPVLNGINSDQDKSLASDARAAYRSMLGFYNGKLAKLGVPGTDRLVAFANDFSRQTGLAELPEIESKTIKKMGLTGVSGLNIVPNISTANSGKGGRGGGSIDQGGGDSRGRGPQSNDPRGGGRGSSFGGRGGGGRGGASSPGPRVGGQYGGRGNDGARRQASTVSNVSPAKRHEPSGSASVAKKPKQEGVEEKALNRSSGATSNNNKNRRRGGGRGSDSNVLP